jgi:FAD:protein FMN transferase
MNIPRSAMFLPLLLAATGALADEPYTFRRPCMGTVWTVKLYAPDEESARAAANGALARVEQLNGTLSDYLPESELSRLSATAGSGRAVTVSGDLMTVLALSREAAAQSGGVFDITIGPFVELWRTAKKTGRLPAADEVKAARAATGWEDLILDRKAGTALLKKPGMKLDPGGIAKGFAQDEAMKVLREKFHIRRALIDAGGSPLVSERPPDRDGWVVQLAKAREDDPDVLLRVENACVDTSGDLNQFVEIDGRRYSHIIDKHTGLGMTDSTQATVVAPSAATADWLATALCLMGPEKGIAFMLDKHPDLPARIVRRESDGSLTVRETPDFAALVVKK